MESEVGDSDDAENIISTHVEDRTFGPLELSFEANLVQLQGGWQKNLIEKDKHNMRQLREACPEEVSFLLLCFFKEELSSFLTVSFE